MKSPRKVGRPRKSTYSSFLSRFENVKVTLDGLMNENLFDQASLLEESTIVSRSKCQNLAILNDEYDRNTEKLKFYYDQYDSLLKEIIQSKSLKSNSEENSISDDWFVFNFSESDDDESTISDQIPENEETIQDEKKKDDSPKRIQRKPPIKEFAKIGFDHLPKSCQQLLSENFDELFNSGLTYKEQIEFTIDLIYDEAGPTAIGKLFGISKGAISSYKDRKGEIRRLLPGRPPKLSDEDIQIVIEQIVNLFDQNDPPTLDTLIDIIYNELEISIKYDTLYRTIKRSTKVKSIEVPVLESTRAEVSIQEIQEHYEKLNTLLTNLNIPPEFCFNVDESGFIDFVDRKKETVIVPFDTPDDMVLGCKRSAKRATMIGAICMDGSKLKPLIIIQNKRIEKDLKINGYGENNVLIVTQDCGFLNSHIFSYWADNILFPEVNRRRQITGYMGDVLLLLDGCSSHFSDYFLDNCTYYGIYVFQEPPGSSDQVQALDLGIFGIQKHFKSQVRINNDLSEQSKNIIQIVNSWIRSTMPDKVVSAFNQSGLFTTQLPDGRYVVRASIEKARAVRGIEHTKCINTYHGRKTVDLVEFR